MRCPHLNELPPPPEGKTGWPWTEASDLLSQKMPDSSDWPRISIVTPSYNQGQFIEETIRSVLLQGYPNLEYIIIDGGSTDNSVEIIKKYEPWLAYWVSEKDRGQSHAINKGLDIASGDILCWLNSDDYFLINALKAISTNAVNINSSKFWLVGKGFEKIENQDNVYFYSPCQNPTIIAEEELCWNNVITQPAVFWSRKLNYRLNESLHYALDWNLWNEFIKEIPPKMLDDYIAVSRVYGTTKCKTGKSKFADELYYVAKKHGGSPLRAFLYRYALWEPQYRGAGKPLSIYTFLPKIWRKIGCLVVKVLFGKQAVQKYTWYFCA
ncbi:glycosyltransferase [Synechocystis sp. LEGE 06083]|uniref:glycosyltransferase family 2 protein n=1 Tax=Synechocystis sp. LEGE 06083 TaxID=915336 RepID=UPI0018803253|nr:glycosyltransferase family 2 protein [Synechocystis sp. LEGE 06083]MBE9194454.1 glycosyltransferase [Synechocystis sp. LEGE 06083]